MKLNELLHDGCGDDVVHGPMRNQDFIVWRFQKTNNYSKEMIVA